jgi:6-phosphogluconolactonase
VDSAENQAFFALTNFSRKVLMTADNRRWMDKLSGETSRRDFLKNSAALAGAAPIVARSPRESATSMNKPLLAYVGTYSNPVGPEGMPGRGEGIYLVEMNTQSGALKTRDVFHIDQNPSWVALDPSRTHLYSVNETGTYKGANSGSVSAYAIDGATGRLTALNTVSSEGAGPCHLSVHPSGKFVLVANYDGGTFTVLPIQSDGSLAAATDVVHQSGPPGPTQPTNGPRGNFSISGHDAPHAHMIEADPSGGFVLGNDLGTDRIMVWKLDLGSGKLVPNEPPSAQLPPGDGPRHFAFSPNGRRLYSLQEEASTLVAFSFDNQSGKLAPEQTLSTLPREFAGTNFPSEIRVSPDGRFIYTANRLHDSLAVFGVTETGELKHIATEWTRGDYPRSITLDPSGNFLYSLNQRADAITVFRIDRETGKLSFTGQYIPMGSPAVLVF